MSAGFRGRLDLNDPPTPVGGIQQILNNLFAQFARVAAIQILRVPFGINALSSFVILCALRILGGLFWRYAGERWRASAW